MYSITVHSFARGSGKTVIASLLAAQLVAQGQRVALIDLDMQFPKLHDRFKLVGESVNSPLSAPHDPVGVPYYTAATPGGDLLIVPAQPQRFGSRISRAQGDWLLENCEQLARTLALDTLVLIAQAGLHELSLATLAFSNSLLLVMRLEQRDYLGTAVILDVAERLNIPDIHFAVNMVPEGYHAATVKLEVEKRYGVPVLAVLPYDLSLLNPRDPLVIPETWQLGALTEHFMQLSGQTSTIEP